MRIFHRLAAASMLSVIVLPGAVKADDSASIRESIRYEANENTLAIPTMTKGQAVDVSNTNNGNASFKKDAAAVRFALCGIEADAGNTSLDAGLIDFNVKDTVRAAGSWYDDGQHLAKNVPDYRSSVFLGVTIGYHF